MRNFLGALGLVGCTDPRPGAVPEFGSHPTVDVVSRPTDELDVPRDLAFHPDHPDQLWVVNQADDSMVIYTAPGTTAQQAEKRIDAYAVHFMEEVSGLAFGTPDRTVDDHAISTFATCQESRNTYNDTSPPNDFMGPVLWPGDLDLFAEKNQQNGLLGSHLDMLHQSPLCMGIAHAQANEYWVFDGYHQRLTWYDFDAPHGYGEDDHSDGRVRRYEDVVLSRIAGVPGHLEVAPDGSLLVADTGSGRVIRVDIGSAFAVDSIPQALEPLDEFNAYAGASVETVVDGLGEPSGLALIEDRLFVADHRTGDIIAVELSSGAEIGRIAVGPGVMGIAIGPDGRIWYTQADANEIGRILPQ